MPAKINLGECTLNAVPIPGKALGGQQFRSLQNLKFWPARGAIAVTKMFAGSEKGALIGRGPNDLFWNIFQKMFENHTNPLLPLGTLIPRRPDPTPN